MIRVGCCGFAGGRAKYFRAFSVVEVQQTFYQPPRLETLARWREEVPPAFEFTVKGWQIITHEATSPTYRRLRACLSEKERREAGAFRSSPVVLRAWETTCQAARVLRADKVLFQCPASFLPTEENGERMRQFFGRIDRQGLRLIWEPRGRWAHREIAALCEELDLVHCVDPFTAKAATGGLQYYRLHGAGSYRYTYSADELRELADSGTL